MIEELTGLLKSVTHAAVRVLLLNFILLEFQYSCWRFRHKCFPIMLSAGSFDALSRYGRDRRSRDAPDLTVAVLEFVSVRLTEILPHYFFNHLCTLPSIFYFEFLGPCSILFSFEVIG